MFLKKRAFTLVEIMIVVAIIALLATIAIPHLLRSRLNAAETNAQTALRAISTAFESYAAREGNYDVSVAGLAGDEAASDTQDPPYLSENYTDGIKHGYDFDCTSGVNAYSCTAEPQGAFEAGGRTFNITTGGVLTTVEDPEDPDGGGGEGEG